MLLTSIALATLLESQQVAVLRSGLRVEARAPAVGDLALHTPLGRLSTPLDPVVEVVDGATQLAQLKELRAEDQLDDEALLLDLSTAGQLTAMAELATAMQVADRHQLLPYDMLEMWADRVDPVPRSVKRDDRVQWLWKRARGKDFVPAVIAGQRLIGEVSEGRSVSNDRILTVVDMRQGLRDSQPWTRRAAARVAGHLQDWDLRHVVFELSLTDPAAPARDGSAWGAVQIHPLGARAYWSRNLMRNRGTYRSCSARNLGRHGGEEALPVLLHVLSAWDRLAPARFRYAGRRVEVVKNYDRNAHVVGPAPYPDLERARELERRRQSSPSNGLYYYLYLDREYIDLPGSNEVTRYGESLLTELLEALDVSVGETTGHDAVAWLTLYDETYEPVRP